MIKNVIITQSNYIPWKGYFDAISISDEFVVYDDMQYTKRDWRNRNLIKTQQGLKWLTIPVEVKGNFFQKINETKIADKNWNKQHWDILKQSYSKSKKYSETKDFVENLYRSISFDYLTDVNVHFITEICAYLKIDINLKMSSDFILNEERSQRLLDICLELNATDYYSGPAAKAYMDETIFEDAKIGVHYLDYSNYVEYEQLNPPFEHGVSILDLIFNEGEDSYKFLKNKK
jgi:uncharacterized protein YozE (UPF0346 family)